MFVLSYTLNMHSYHARVQEKIILKHLKSFPAAALLGARQVGKSTLAHKIISGIPGSLYLDLEDPRDLARMQDPLAFLEANREKLICLDEIQRLPEIFPLLRSYLDKGDRTGQLLLLGSASRDLIRQSSESLAGRLSFLEIAPFSVEEIEEPLRLWVQGGYPESYLLDEEMSYEWRINYIRTFLERDIPQLGFAIPAEKLKRLWTMLAHMNGSLLNQSTLASSLGISVPTISHYLDILEGTFVIRRLPPFSTNTKKRLVKTPKIYLRDTGLIHTLLGIETYNDLLGHPALGSSYEAFVINSLLTHFPRHQASFYRTSGGAEIDLILEKAGHLTAIEIKASSSPQPSRGFYESLKSLQPDQTVLIAQVPEPFPGKHGIPVHNVKSFLESASGKGS